MIPPHARRLALLALAAVLAGVLAGSQVLLGVTGHGPGPRQSYLNALESYGYAGHAGNHEGTRADLRADRARRARCARPAYRAAHPVRCPAVPGQAPAGLREMAADSDGSFEAPRALPVLGIHGALLPTGKVLYFAYPNGDKSLNEGTAWLWDPAADPLRTNLKRVDPPIASENGNKPANIWCAGQALLPDGRLLVVGGNLAYDGPNAGFKGAKFVLTFDPFTETWKRWADMNHGRWYPTVVTLPDGRAVIMGGWDESGDNLNNGDVEVFDPVTNTLSRKVSAYRQTMLYPHLFVVPGGKVLLAGPGKPDSALLNTSTWTWQDLPQLPARREWGSAVLMPGGPGGSTKVALIGGSDTPTVGGTKRATNTSAILDLNNTAAGWQPGPSLGVGRGHLNTTILPDGSLVTIGGGAGSVNGSLYAEPVYSAELLDAGSSAWRTVVSQADERTYHSTALLLPDGRVASAGDDRPGHTVGDTSELYSPPYLSRGPRPVLSYAPAAVAYGRPFVVGTPNPSAITRAVLIRPSGVTHANDMSQRSIELTRSVGADGLTLTSPANATLAPPGYYMLFLLDANGVPSTARFVKLDPAAPDPAPPPANPGSSGPALPGPSTPPGTFGTGQSLARLAVLDRTRIGVGKAVTVRFRIRAVQRSTILVRLATRKKISKRIFSVRRRVIVPANASRSVTLRLTVPGAWRTLPLRLTADVRSGARAQVISRSLDVRRRVPPA